MHLGLLLAVVSLVAILAAVFYSWSKGPSHKLSPPQLITSAATQATNAIGSDRKATSVEQIIQSMVDWQTRNPSYHAIAETSVAGGGVVSRADIFVYRESTNGTKMVSVKTEILGQYPMQMLVQRKGDELVAYFPRSEQLIRIDTTNELTNIPGWAADHLGISLLVKLASRTMIETNPGVQVVTFVVAPGALNVPEAVGEMFNSLRVDSEGKLLGVEQMAFGQSISSRVRYLTFNQDQVRIEAPVLPVAKAAPVTKRFKEAIEEEMHFIANKQIRTTI